MSRSFVSRWSLIAFALVCAMPAFARSGCAVTSPIMDFVTYDPTSGSNDTATATITVSCIKDVGDGNFNFRVHFSVGGGTFTARTMTNGIDALSYNLYTDAAYTLILGDGTAPSTFLSGTLAMAAASVGATVSQTFTIYGLVTAGQDLSAGSYAPASVITTDFRSQGGGPPATLATGTLGVREVLSNACAISADATLAFGTYNPLSATPLDASTAFSFKCTKNSSFDIGLGGTVGSRSMSSGVDTLGFELYSDSGRSQAWGNSQDSDTVNADDANDATGNGISAAAAVQTRTVYGRIPPGQDKSPGSYSATVTITIYY